MRPQLPPMYEVLYQESVRGNHLLFPDIEPNYSVEPGDELVCRLLTHTQLTYLHEDISRLPVDVRASLFALYLRAIGEWSAWVRECSN